MKFKILFIMLLISTLAFAEDGTITGILTEKNGHQKALSSVTVTIKELNIQTTTDADGKFSLLVPPGTYIVEFTLAGYESTEQMITVSDGQTTITNESLAPSSSYNLKEVVIRSSRNREKETAILLEQKNAVVTKQSIGAQEMSRKGVNDVATAVTKTTGISKQEGSGDVFVRGLGDRYNQTTINGLPLPSNDTSKKNIDLGLFNTNIVESVGIDKTYHFKDYGDFGGANIDIVSKSYTGKGMLEAGFDLEFNSQVVGLSNFRLQDGPTKSGFYNANYPSDPFSAYNFTTNWNTNSETPFNTSYFVRGGYSFNVGKTGKLGFFGSASFDGKYNYKEGISNGGVMVDGLIRKDLTFESFSYDTNTTLLGNINYKINTNNSLFFNTMYINSSSQEHEEYNGVIDLFDIAQEGGGYIRRSNFDKTTLIINQLLGKHKFSEKLDLKWGASYNTSENVVPDRMVNTLVPVDNEGDLSIKKISDNNESENHRYYQNLMDDQIAANFALDYKFNKYEDGYKGKITLGYSGYSKKVSFEATQFNFNIDNEASQPVVEVTNIDGYFNQTNFDNKLFEINTFNGGLTPQTYDGNQDIQSGFAGIEYAFNPKLTVLFGTRAEYIVQNINWFTNLGEGTNKFDKVEILPSLNVKYALNKEQNLKLAGSKTYTLPQFKERAPFQFENVTTVQVGNPNLYPSTNYNADVKWEYFPKSNEVISVTGFGKLIQNPINEVTIASATNDISFLNTGEKAVVFGAEFEIRKNIFSTEAENKQNLTAGFNASYMYNNQDFSTEKVEKETDLSVFFTNKEGRLTGASDLLMNADMTYFKEFSKDNNVQGTITYNYFSDRVYAIGTSGRGDLVDQAVGTLDFILKSKFTKNISMGFAVKNILDPTIERIQEDQDVLVESYKKGINYKISLAYTF